MMPDTSGGDSSTLWTGITVVITGIIAWIGANRGDKDRKTVPAPTPELAGVSFGLIDKATQVAMAADAKRTADACEATNRMFAEWIDDEKDRRQVEKEQTTGQRIGKLEDMLEDIFRRMDDSETAQQRRHIERGGQR